MIFVDSMAVGIYLTADLHIGGTERKLIIMRSMILTDKVINDIPGLCMWLCPNCLTYSSVFSKDGSCVCGKRVDFLKWKLFYLYEITPEQKDSVDICICDEQGCNCSAKGTINSNNLGTNWGQI